MNFVSNVTGVQMTISRQIEHVHAPRTREATRFAVVLAMAAVAGSSALAQEQIFSPFELPKNDPINAQALANRLAALSPRVDRNEAKTLAESAYATVTRLRREYRMFGTPIFNNFLVYHGLRKRGYCYHWMADLLVALDALKIKTLELHWGETYAGTWRENNCLVVTAKGQSFDRGIMLESWSHLGHLRWHAVLSDEDHYVENKKYAQRVLARSASAKVHHETSASDQGSSEANHHVAFQKNTIAKPKAGD